MRTHLRILSVISCSLLPSAGLIGAASAADPDGKTPFAGFDEPVFYPTGAGAGWVVSADLDNDGDLDLAVSASQEHAVFIHLNDGHGVFTLGQVIPAGASPSGIQPLDFTGDGLLDLIVNDSLGDSIQFFENLGDATFQFSHQIAAGANPSNILAGDLDGDGDDDLVVDNVFSSSVQLLINDGDNNFSTTLFITPGTWPVDLKLADMDNDGDLDILTANILSDDFTILLNNGDATFAKPWRTNVNGVPFGITPGDYDNDGDMDLILDDSVHYHILRRVGPGLEFTQQIHSIVPDGYALGYGADIDNDGNLDWLVLHGNNDDTVNEVIVNFGATDGMLTGFLDISLDPSHPGLISQSDLIAVLNNWGSNLSYNGGGADFNGDGVVDGLDLSRLLVNWGPGHGSLVYSHNFGEDTAPGRLTIADIDHDGDQDIIEILLNVNGTFVAVLKNRLNSPQPR